MSSSNVGVSLSGIHKVLPCRESPYADEAEAIVRDFAASYGLMPANFEDYNTMSRFLYPGAVSPKRLAAACMVHSLFLFIDGLFFDFDNIRPENHGIDPALRSDPSSLVMFIWELMHIFRTRNLPPEPTTLQHAFCYAGDYVAHAAGDELWFQYFVDTVEDYIDAVLYRSRNLDQPTEDLFSFAELRERDTGGLYTCRLIELTNDITLPEEVRDLGILQTLTTIAIRHASFIKDIFLYPIDALDESNTLNLVKRYMDYEDFSVEEAMQEAIDLVNSYTNGFLNLERGLNGGPEAIRYVQGLKEMFSGNIYWQLTTERYRLEEFLFRKLPLEYFE